jgi:hypothetical protein
LVTARAALVGAALASVLLAAPPAAAQTPAPGSTTAPAAPTDEPTPPPAPPAVSPALEAGDTAAPGAPVQPLVPPATTATAVPGAIPPSIVQGSLGTVPPREQRRRVYETRWFWGALGVVVITAAVVLVFAVNSANPTTPSTKLGDMRAF